MSIVDYLPRLGLLDRSARQPRHSAPAEAERLRNRLTWADLLIKAQRVQISDAEHKLAVEQERRRVAERELAQAEATIRLRNQEISDLKRRVDVGVKAEHVIAKTQEIDPEEVRRYCITPVHLSKAPFATANPGRLPILDRPDPAA